MGLADVIMQAIFYIYDHEKNISGAPGGEGGYILQLHSRTSVLRKKAVASYNAFPLLTQMPLAA